MDNPIRVLQILHSMNRGGAENALMNYYRHIDRTKVQFDFLLSDPDHTLFEDEITSLGGRIYRIPRLTLKSMFSYCNAIRSFLKAHPEYRIVHSHTSSKSVIPLGIAKSCGVPVRIAHSHAAKSAKGIKGVMQQILMPLLKFTATDRLACGNDAAIWLYGQKAFDNGETRVFKNVIETSKFKLNFETRNKIRASLGISEDTLLIGNVARLCYQKNQKFAIAILKELVDLNQNTALAFLGTGDDDLMLRSLARDLGIENQVRFVGVVPNTYDYYQAFDIFLLPSLYEGLPLVLTEAQISGLRCVSSDTVDHNSDITGLVKFVSLDLSAKEWAKIILDYSDYKRTCHQADVIKAGYDAETKARDLESFYIECNKRNL